MKKTTRRLMLVKRKDQAKPEEKPKPKAKRKSKLKASPEKPIIHFPYGGWILKNTKKDAVRWFLDVQKCIAAHTSPPRTRGKYKGHGTTDTKKWIDDLYWLIWRKRPKGKAYDENMYLAAAMGYVLVLWYTRIQRAKAYDPRRPIEIRKGAIDRIPHYLSSLVHDLLDDSIDAHTLAGQDFEPPYGRNATDGKFV
jgi:hypothetical protein